MIQITDTIVLDDREIKERFVRATGPDGQNINKVARRSSCASTSRSHRWRAAKPPKERKPTKPRAAAREEGLISKKQQGAVKRSRSRRMPTGNSVQCASTQPSLKSNRATCSVKVPLEHPEQ